MAQKGPCSGHSGDDVDGKRFPAHPAASILVGTRCPSTSGGVGEKKEFAGRPLPRGAGASVRIAAPTSRPEHGYDPEIRSISGVYVSEGANGSTTGRPSEVAPRFSGHANVHISGGRGDRRRARKTATRAGRWLTKGRCFTGAPAPEGRSKKGGAAYKARNSCGEGRLRALDTKNCRYARGERTAVLWTGCSLFRFVLRARAGQGKGRARQRA